MEAAEVLKQAWKAVQESGVPESMQEAAFKEAVALLQDAKPSPKPKDTKPRSGSGGSGRGREKPAEDGESDEAPVVEPAEFFQRIATETGAQPDDIEKVLHLSGKKVGINLPARSLGATAREQMKNAAYLISGGEQFGLGEHETPTTTVRAELTRLRCLDAKNFNTAIGSAAAAVDRSVKR